MKGRKIPKEIVDKVNKNPEKIRKTAEKHKGMKRSQEAKDNMSEAAKKRIKEKGIHNKGKIYCYNIETFETILCLKDEIPEGYVKGFGSVAKKKVENANICQE